MRRLNLLLAALLLATLSAPAQAADKLTLLLDWFMNPDHGPIVVADQRGYFVEEGLDVEWVEPANPNDPPRLVAAGQGDLAISYQPQLHILADEGLPVTRISTLVATPLNALVVLEDGPIKSISDLRGSKIGFSVGGFEDALLSAMLAKYDLSLDDVTLINVNWSLSPSLVSGQVDAVIGAFRNFELNQMDIIEHPGRAFYPELEGVPVYDELIVIAANDNLEDPRFPRFNAAIERAVLTMINDPEGTWQDFITAYPDLDDELNRRAWRDTLPRFALRPAALDQARYDRFGAFLKAQGLVKSAGESSDFTTVLK